MTDSEFLSWLKRGGRYAVLVEVDTSTPRYLSTVAYTTLPTDTPANRAYSPVIAGGVALSEALPLDGSATLSVGDIAVNNQEGYLDSWFSDIWVNRSIRVYVGDVSWPRADFRLIFDGIVSDLGASSAELLVIKIRDKLQRLNTPVTDTQLGGSTANSDRLTPVCMGEVHNVSPLLVDPAVHEYQVHGGAIERIIEVRADGVPRTITETLSTGKFRLTAAPVGTITASVQGATSYTNTVAGIIQKLATSYGTPSERLTSGDLDSAQLGSFNTAHPQPVGVYLEDRGNVLAVCQELAASVGAQVSMSRLGKLRLLKIALPASGTNTDIKPQDYEAQSLEIVSRPSVIAGQKLGFCKNWTVQASVDTGIPSEHKELFAREWLTAVARDSTVATNYRLYAEPEQTDTLLLKSTDAQAEATRRLNLWKVPRTVYRLVGFSNLLLLELGQPVTLYGNRFDLASGKSGQVISLESDWIGRRVTVEVLV